MFYKIKLRDKVTIVHGKQHYGDTFLVHVKDDYYVYNHDWYNNGNIEYTLILVEPNNIEPYLVPGLVKFMNNDIRCRDEAMKILKSKEFKNELGKI